MGTLYLVRHGQASLGAADYDNLSDLGRRQAKRLGEYFAARDVGFEAVLTGSLKRHAQTWAGIAEGAGFPHNVLEWPGLNEYDSQAVIEAIHPGPLAKPDTPELYRQHFRLLREGLRAWMDGSAAPTRMPSYRDFVHGVTSALDHVRKEHSGNVLMVSSGGPISTAVGHVLGTSAETTIELNLRIRNSALTEFVFNPKRHMLLSFNHLPHLDGEEYKDWVSYA
ncbi:MAG: histidine phosphatase family protein [Burkholderiales bacterium]